MKDIKSANSVERSARWIAVGMVIFTVVLLLNILRLQTCDYEKYEQKVISQLTTGSTLTADRGKITDSNGVVLATNITTYRVFISPSSIKSASEDDDVEYDKMIAEGLSSIIEGVTYDKVMTECTYTDKLDRTIAKEVKKEVAELVWSFINENGLNDMVYTEATGTRYYPYGELAASVIGTVGSGYGLEAQYNEYLTGTDGKYITARDASGNEMPYEYDSYIPAVNGYDVTTTIDAYVQAALEEQLETTYKECGGKNRACGIVMDVNTGAIIAMAVYPAYDLNESRTLNWQAQENFDKEVETENLEKGSDEYNALFTESILKTWSNKAITEPYMPGSTFKVMTASMAYEEDLVDEDETFSCPGYWVVSGQTIHCHYLAGHGNLTFAHGLQQSCNPILMQMGLRIGADRYLSYFNSFGYRQKTGVDLPGEVAADSTAYFWDDETFKSADIYLATASFGQNFKVTPLQQLTAVSAVANGGYLVTPHLVESINDSNGSSVYTFENGIRRQILSTATCEKVSQVLEEGVAGDGGSKNAYVAGYRIAAKTGTSEKKDEDDDSLGYKKYVCSCVAFAPADNPQYSAIILVDEPTEGILYASVIAAPYMANLFETILPYLGVETEYSAEELEAMAIETPSITYWGVKIGTDFANSMGFEVEVIGDGDTIMSQSPAAGEKVEKGNAKIIVYTDSKTKHETVKVPDVIGKTATAANQILANRNLNIKISGTSNYMSGTSAIAYIQEPAAGTEVEAGTVVTVNFRYIDDKDD